MSVLVLNVALCRQSSLYFNVLQNQLKNYNIIVQLEDGFLENINPYAPHLIVKNDAWIIQANTFEHNSEQRTFSTPFKWREMQSVFHPLNWVWVFGDIFFDPLQRCFSQHTQNSLLKTCTVGEYACAILNYLSQAPHFTASKNALRSFIWQHSSDIESHALESHIHQLRQKLHKTFDIAVDQVICTTPQGEYALRSPISHALRTLFPSGKKICNTT